MFEYFLFESVKYIGERQGKKKRKNTSVSYWLRILGKLS